MIIFQTLHIPSLIPTISIRPFMMYKIVLNFSKNLLHMIIYRNRYDVHNFFYMFFSYVTVKYILLLKCNVRDTCRHRNAQKHSWY